MGTYAPINTCMDDTMMLPVFALEGAYIGSKYMPLSSSEGKRLIHPTKIYHGKLCYNREIIGWRSSVMNWMGLRLFWLTVSTKWCRNRLRVNYLITRRAKTHEWTDL